MINGWRYDRTVILRWGLPDKAHGHVEVGRVWFLELFRVPQMGSLRANHGRLVSLGTRHRFVRVRSVIRRGPNIRPRKFLRPGSQLKPSLAHLHQEACVHDGPPLYSSVPNRCPRLTFQLLAHAIQSVGGGACRGRLLRRRSEILVVRAEVDGALQVICSTLRSVNNWVDQPKKTPAYEHTARNRFP